MRRLRSWCASAGLALIALCLGSASPALASPAAFAANGPECTEEFAEGTEFFEPGQEVLPPAFRSIPYDCATLAPTADLSPEGRAIYRLIFLEPTFDEYLDMVRSLEREGWVQGDSWQNITYADGSTGVSYEVTPDELAALDEVPELVQHWFGTENADSDIQMYWSTGNLLFFEQTHVDVAIALGFRYSTTDLAAPSTFSELRTIADALPTPTQTAVIAGTAVVLMLVVGWPSTLLNSVVGSRYQSLVTWMQGRLPRRKDAKGAAPSTSGDQLPDAPTSSGSRLPGWLMWPGFAAAALIGAFVDPDFGVNPMSARVVLMLFCSFVLFNLATWSIVRRIALRIQPDSRPYLRFRWGTLLIVALAVVIARLLELEPGIVFGLVAGIAFATALRASGSAAVVLAGSGFGLALALVAWVGYSLLSPVAAGTPGILPLVLGVEFLSAVTVKGVSSLPLALLPLGTLEGSKVFTWNRWAWAGAYALGLAAFMLVMLSIPKSWGEVPGDFVRWLVLFGVYTAIAVIVWAVNSWLVAKRPPKHTTPDEQPDAITLD